MQFHIQQALAYGLCTVIARSRHGRDVLVKRQTPIEHDPQHFDIMGLSCRVRRAAKSIYRLQVVIPFKISGPLCISKCEDW